MLLILMYHRVHGRGRDPEALRTHLRLIRERHPVVLPGEPLPHGRLSVCLSFDDATADFRHEVYPLLRELDCRALVAVPTRYIQADTELDLARRLAAQEAALMSGDYAAADCPLCTWAELREMQDSGLVACASHSHSHADLADPRTDLDQELDRSAELMERYLGRRPDTLVYPYGASNRAVQREVARRYPHAMRIGSALNSGWRSDGGPLYRVDAEHFWPGAGLWSRADTLGWGLKYLGNRLRGK